MNRLNNITGGAISHSTRLPNDGNQVAGYKPLMWLMALLLAALVAGCGGGGGGGTIAPSSAKAIDTFSLAWTTGTPGSATGIINQTNKTINLTVPYGTNRSPMFATFTTTGTKVTVGSPEVTQVNGTTANDFTNPVAYKVYAADGTWATYTVIITVSANTAKAITTFTLATPTSIGTVFSGTSSPYNIAVTMPFGTSNLTALVATFTTTGSSVKVGTTVQTSGTTSNDFTNSITTPVVYTVTAANGSTATYNVTVTVALSSAKAITAFSLAAVSGVPASTTTAITGTVSPFDILVTMPNGTTDLTALVATFTTNGASSVKVGTTVQTSGTSQNDFSAASGASAVPVTYLVTAPDASTATYDVTVQVATVANPTPPTLGEAGRFVILAYAGVTTTGVTAVSNGDIGVIFGARSTITGFTASGGSGAYTELANGMSYAPDDTNPAPFPYPLHYSTPTIGAAWTTTGAMLTQAQTDLGIAYTFLAADPNPGAPTQVCPTELGGLTLTPGVYKTASNVGITTGTLTLDAQGDPNAVWIFNISGTLTTGAPGGNIVFAGGVGQAKNVFWRVAGITSIGGGTGTTFLGSVYDYANVDLTSGSSVTGSLYSTTASVTLIGNTITKAP